MNAFFELSSARSVDQALPVIRRIRAIPLNMVFADKDNIAWQVIGNYPVRAKDAGCCRRRAGPENMTGPGCWIPAACRTP